ncbi:sulfotransferase 1E1 [Lepeophtheirus salmonis]|uniref:sulfotransferase 1E1 n=1 Tax=Lepeophtheirus salmonis TaxID=72036 RepID=UPI001AE256C3|nr:sulfotransferase 1E1-like [Lepeophtheirus salmonis]
MILSKMRFLHKFRSNIMVIAHKSTNSNTHVKNKVQTMSKGISFAIYGSILLSGMFAFQAYLRRREMQKLISEYVPANESFKKNFKMVVYEDCVLTEDMVMSSLMTNISKFPLRKDDIIVASFPKSGTTWLQEIVYELHNPESIEIFPEESTDVMEHKFPYLEYVYPGLQEIERRPSPRLIKTHLPLHLLPEDVLKGQAKVIYIHRNPKDVIVSYFYFLKSLSYTTFIGNFSEFFTLFIKNRVPYAPYFPHINEYVKKAKSSPSQFLILNYEEMKKNPADCILKIADFLGLDTPSDEILYKILSNTSFESMKKNPSTNYSHWIPFGLRLKNGSEFMRKGIIGDHKNHFTPELNSTFDIWRNKFDADKLVEFIYE